MTLIDQVTWREKDSNYDETIAVMTRRVRWPWNRSRTTVLPIENCGDTPGFIIYWNTSDGEALKKLHAGMVQVIGQIGFLKPAIWCESRLENRSSETLPMFWKEHLGDLFRYYRKAI